MKASPQLRARIEEAAKQSGLSLSQEVERRLIASFDHDDMAGGAHNATFLRFAAAFIAEAEESVGARWTEDVLAWDVVRSGILGAINRRRPEGYKFVNYLNANTDVMALSLSPDVEAWLLGSKSESA